MIELALDSELLVVFGGSDDENPCIFACYQGIWVQRRVRSRLSPPAASLQTVGPPRDEGSGRQSGGETNRRTTLPSSCGDMPCGGVAVPDLPGDTHQVGIIQLRRHIVFVGLGEEPAKTQGLVEDRQGDIERRLPFFDPKRNLPATLARADVIMASQAEGIEAERLLPLARDGDP